MKLLPALLLVGAAFILCPAAQAQNVAAIYTPTTGSNGDTSTPAHSTGTVVVHGVVKCPEGALPGAVVHLNNSRTYVVTDAKGGFDLPVPAATSAVDVTCSYAGFIDTVLRLKTKSETTTIMLDKEAALPPRDRSTETMGGW